MEKFFLKDKVVIITGAAGGVGKKLALDFSKMGSKVVICDINRQGLENTFQEIQNKENTILHQLDVTDYSSWEKLLSTIFAKWNQIDILMNVAGYLLPGYIFETDKKEIDKHIDINIKGVIFGTHSVSKLMVKQKFGQIINIASLAGISPVPGLDLYSTTKFAVRGFSLSIAPELKKNNVFVSVVCPDAIQTPMLDIQKDRKEAGLTFSGKVLTVEDISNVIFKKVLIKKPVQISIPGFRGFLALLPSLFPSLMNSLMPIFYNLGLKKQKKYKTGT